MTWDEVNALYWLVENYIIIIDASDKISSLYWVCCQNLLAGDTDLSKCCMYLNKFSLIYIFRFAFVTFRHLSDAKNCIRAVNGYEHKGRVLKCLLNEGITFFGKIFNLQNMSVHPTFRLAVLLGIMSVSTYKSAVSIYIMTIATCTSTFYWSACTKPEKWTVIYLYVTGIDFDIWFWNCSDSVVFVVFLLDFGIVQTVWYLLFFY